jgi:hypothetical protein
LGLAFEPALVASARERLQVRDTVARRTVAETVAFLVLVGARVPDELDVGESEVLVEVVPRAADDTRRAGAPLEAEPARLNTYANSPICRGFANRHEGIK